MGLSHSPVVPPGLSGLSTHECGTTRSASCCLAVSPLHPLPVSTPPASLDECFCFISLVVGFPYSLILWLFWLFFVFKRVVVLLLCEVVRGGAACLQFWVLLTFSVVSLSPRRGSHPSFLACFLPLPPASGATELPFGSRRSQVRSFLFFRTRRRTALCPQEPQRRVSPSVS